jgi:hypothetical protein
MSVSFINHAIGSRPQADSRRGETPHIGVPTSISIFIAAILLTLYCVLRFPELGALIAQYNQF